jgi:hypothetical protein
MTKLLILGPTGGTGGTGGFFQHLTHVCVRVRARIRYS